MATKNDTQEAVKKMQSDAIETIKTYQDNTVKTLEAWHDVVAKVTPETPALPEVPNEIRALFGDPAAIVDSSYDFASQVLELNKRFAHQLLQVSQSAAQSPKPAQSQSSK